LFFQRVFFFSSHFGVFLAEFIKRFAVFKEQFSQLFFFEVIVIGSDLVETSSNQLSFSLLNFGCFHVLAGLFLKLLFSGKVFLLPFGNGRSEISTSVVVVIVVGLFVLMVSSRVVVVVWTISLLFLVVLDFTILEASVRRIISLENFI
jgi:hypothetical protein